jgi:hypothetical protein
MEIKISEKKEEEAKNVSFNDNKKNIQAVAVKKEKINNLSPEWGVMLTLQENLNLRIGTQMWKKYISAAFWNYISTPINFIITLFTALSASQTGTKTTFLSDTELFYILLTSFILSIVNTFFKLKEKSILNYDAAKKYDKFGSLFEVIYFKPINSNEDILTKYNEYKKLQKDINDYCSEESIENVNYITELIYLCTKHLFLKQMKRINKGERYWVLDGKSITRYNSKKFKVDVGNLFVYNFNDIHNKEEHKHTMFDSFFYKSPTKKHGDDGSDLQEDSTITEEHDDYNSISNDIKV